jgi:hypothetical protein
MMTHQHHVFVDVERCLLPVVAVERTEAVEDGHAFHCAPDSGARGNRLRSGWTPLTGLLRFQN